MKTITATAMITSAILAFAGDITLPEPAKSGGMPLADALNARQSQRAFADTGFTPQVLSDLLWAANGVNRPDGRRTAPTARNRGEIDVYALTEDGAFLFNPAGHTLTQVNTNDLRAVSGFQGFVHNAPVVLVMVVNRAKQGSGAGDRISDRYAAMDTGYVSQNIYLFAAANGMSSVALGTLDAKSLHTSLKLGENDEALLAQPVGYPK